MLSCPLSSPCRSLVTKTSALAKEWETVLCMRLSVSCDTRQFGMCLGLSLAHCVCCTIIHRQSQLHLYRVQREWFSEKWTVGLAYSQWWSLNILVGLERFLFVALFLFGAQSLLGHSSMSSRSHVHVHRPPHTLSSATTCTCTQLFQSVAYCLCSTLLKKIKPSFTSLKLWRKFFQCVLLYTYLIRWCNGLFLQYPFLPLTLLSHQWLLPWHLRTAVSLREQYIQLLGTTY